MNNTYLVNTQKTDLYNIEYIITRRTEGKKNFYLIKWEGYPIKDCSWEPISHLSNIKDMVQKFDDNFPYSINQKALKEFYIELQKYEHKKYLQKKRILKNIKNKKQKSKKIIISLFEFNLDSIDNNEEKEEPIKIEINSTVDINENKENNDTLVKDFSINLDKDNSESFETNNFGKLKKPILIW